MLGNGLTQLSYGQAMKKSLLLAPLCAITLLTSCMIPTDRTVIRVSTVPEGAMLVNSDGQLLGQEPLNIEWMPESITAVAPNVWQTTPITAIWPSGSKTTTSFTYSGEMLQYGITGVIRRNMNDPNLQADMQNANQVLQLRQQQQVIDAIETETMMRSMQPRPIHRPPPPRHHPRH